MLVSQTLDALTPSGAITLYSEVRSYPEILSLSNAPSGWNELPNEAQELIVSTAHARSLDISLVNGDPRSPEIIAREFSFPVYLINEVALSAFESKLNKTFVFYQNQRDKFPPPLAFEITQADVYGLGLKVVYLSDNPIDPEHPQALVVVQGPSKDIVSNLKLSLPVWQTSVPISASIAGKETQGWLISEGLLRKSGDNPLIGLMFELEDTFIYLEGQNIPEKELIDVASSLQVVNREQIEQGYSVYLPAVLSGN